MVLVYNVRGPKRGGHFVVPGDPQQISKFVMCLFCPFNWKLKIVLNASYQNVLVTNELVSGLI